MNLEVFNVYVGVDLLIEDPAALVTVNNNVFYNVSAGMAAENVTKIAFVVSGIVRRTCLIGRTDCNKYVTYFVELKDGNKNC